MKLCHSLILCAIIAVAWWVCVHYRHTYTHTRTRLRSALRRSRDDSYRYTKKSVRFAPDT